jgi:hypothetical protein
MYTGRDKPSRVVHLDLKTGLPLPVAAKFREDAEAEKQEQLAVFARELKDQGLLDVLNEAVGDTVTMAKPRVDDYIAQSIYSGLVKTHPAAAAEFREQMTGGRYAEAEKTAQAAKAEMAKRDTEAKQRERVDQILASSAIGRQVLADRKAAESKPKPKREWTEKQRKMLEATTVGRAILRDNAA